MFVIVETLRILSSESFPCQPSLVNHTSTIPVPFPSVCSRSTIPAPPASHRRFTMYNCLLSSICDNNNKGSETIIKVTSSGIGRTVQPLSLIRTQRQYR